MSGELILPNGRPKKTGRHGKDFATLNEAFSICEGMLGPIAVIVQELMVKVARLEDRAGITDETIQGEAAPRGTPYGESAMGSKP